MTLQCQREIQLDPLSKVEAWTLFKKHSWIHDEENYSSSKLLDVAHKVVSECKGLPENDMNYDYAHLILSCIWENLGEQSEHI